MRSMTGYGRYIVEQDGRQVSLELKSVNHRYLDINIRIPRVLSFADDMLRREISKRIARSHVDVYVNYTNARIDAKSVFIDSSIMNAYQDAFLGLSTQQNIISDLSLTFLLSQPEVVQLQANEEDEEAIAQMLLQAIDKALRDMVDMRKAEGAQLHADMEQKIKRLSALLESIEQRQIMQLPLFREKLAQRMAQILKDMPLEMQMDEARISAEAAIFADKTSIDEEIVRLKSHFAQFLSLMDSGDVVGRRLDFLTQEINREFNTIGSKAADLDITNDVLEAKNELEKLREQTQNVE